MEPRFITHLSQLISEESQQTIQEALFVDEALGLQAARLGEVVGSVLPLFKGVALSEKIRSEELNTALETVQRDLEVIFADMAMLSETIDRLSLLSEATVGAINKEMSRLYATLKQYRAKLFAASSSDDVFRYVDPLTRDSNAAELDVTMLVDLLRAARSEVLKTRTPATFDALLGGYVLSELARPVGPGEAQLSVHMRHPSAIPDDASLPKIVDDKPESYWAETLLIDAPLASGAQAVLDVSLSAKRSLNKFYVAPFNRTAISSVKLFVEPNEGEIVYPPEGHPLEGLPTFKGLKLESDPEEGFYVVPEALRNLSEESGMVVLDRGIPTKKLRLHLIQLRYANRKVELEIAGLNPIATPLDADRMLDVPLWGERLASEQNPGARRLDKYEYVYGLKDLRLIEAAYETPVSRYVSAPIAIDGPLDGVFLSADDKPVWRDPETTPFDVYDSEASAFAPKLPLEAFVDYRVRVVTEDLLDDPVRYASGMAEQLAGWGPLSILSQEWDEAFGGWVYDKLEFTKAHAASGWVAPLRTRPLDWANDPFATKLASSATRAAVYLNGKLIERGLGGKVTYYQFLAGQDHPDYGLHILVPFAQVPETSDIGGMQFVAVYRPDPDYLGQELEVIVPSSKFALDVFATSANAALMDADNAASGASGALMVAPGVSRLELRHRVQPGIRPIVSKRKVDGTYVPLFQQYDPRNPYLYRTAHAGIVPDSVRFNGKPLLDVFGATPVEDSDGYLVIDLSAHPSGGVLTYLHGGTVTGIPSPVTEIASVRRDFTLDGKTLVLSEPLKAGELLKVSYSYYRYGLVLDVRLQRLSLDEGVTPTLSGFSLSGTWRSM